MSLAHELRVLELESQTELLERLQLLTNFGSNLITVGGVQGAGKSWLAQRYLEAWSADKNQSLLLCHPNQDDAQRRSTLLSQISSSAQFNHHDSFIDSFANFLDGEPCDVVIVVDDAHLLTESLISDLWMLVLEAQRNPAWTINVVLFARSNSIDSLLSRLSYGQEHKPIDIEIESFNQQESDRFFEQLVMRFVEDDVERGVRNAYRKVALRPGDIMALGEQKVEKRIIIRSIVGSPTKIALIILLLLMLLGGGYWWLMSQPSPDEKAQQITDNIEQTVIPTLPSVTSGSESTVVGVELGDDIDEVDPSFDGAEDDSQSLPPDVVDETASVGAADSDQQRVVITSDVVDALLEGKAEQVDTTVIDEAVVGTTLEADTQAQLSDDSLLDNNEDKQPAVISFSFAREQLLEFSSRSYTLQLAALNTLEETQSFINKYNLDGKVRVYPTIRGELDWYIVTYDNYPTIQLARDAVGSLPEDLQSLEPWAKSLSQVHREIERVK